MLGVAFDVLTVATRLSHPWSIAFLPDGLLLVTTRDGRLRTVDRGGALSPPVAGLPPVDARGQGGLLGLALDPAFGSNRLIYWSYPEPRSGGNNTAVARGRLADDGSPIDGVQVIFHQTPSLASRLHSEVDSCSRATARCS
jgi:aldose sugar dehydrogenase